MTDTDKLLRAVFDALTLAGIWGDDKEAVVVNAEKTYDVEPGLTIRITQIEGEQ